MVSKTGQTYVTHLGCVDAQIALMLPAVGVCLGLERISETEIEGQIDLSFKVERVRGICTDCKLLAAALF